MSRKLKDSKIKNGDFMDGIIVINKPAGMTSHDVINKLRKKYHQKKFGHTGTLDPEATGVLIVLCGKACKILQFLQDTDKKYIGSIQLGYSTTTDDVQGEIVERKDVNMDFDFQEVLNTFKGRQHQKVPFTSAKKINGKKLMEYQRENKDVEPVYSDVEIYDIQALDEEELSFEVSCSSGTYVRSICRDFGLKTNNRACMKSLQRTAVGRFTIDQAQDLEDELVVYPTKLLLDHFPWVEYKNILDVYQGKAIRVDCEADFICILDEGEPVAIYEKLKEGLYKSKRGLW